MQNLTIKYKELIWDLRKYNQYSIVITHLIQTLMLTFNNRKNEKDDINFFLIMCHIVGREEGSTNNCLPSIKNEYPSIYKKLSWNKIV